MHLKIPLILIAVLCFSPISIQALTFDESNNILTLLDEEKYTQLNTLIGSYFERYNKNKNNEKDVDHALEAIYIGQPWMNEKIEKWIKHSPDSYLPYLYKGLYHHRLGWENRGKKYISETTKKQVDKMIYHFNISKLNFKKALNLEPSLLHAYAYLINIAMNSKNNTELEGYYEKGLKINPYSHRLHLFYSFSLKPRWGGSIDALKLFSDEMILLSKDNPKLMALAGTLEAELGDEYKNGNLFTALEHYKNAEAYGGYWYLYLKMGNAYLKMYKLDEALSAYNNLAYIRPMYPDVYYKLAHVYMNKGNHEKALEFNQIARNMDPDRYDYITLEGQLLYNVGDYENALIIVKKAKQLKPEDKRLDGFISMIENKLKSNI